MNYKTITNILEFLFVGKEELVDKGRIIYLALLSTEEKLQSHLDSLQYLVDNFLIEGYSYQNSATNTYLFTVYNKED